MNLPPPDPEATDLVKDSTPLIKRWINWINKQPSLIVACVALLVAALSIYSPAAEPISDTTGIPLPTDNESIPKTGSLGEYNALGFCQSDNLKRVSVGPTVDGSGVSYYLENNNNESIFWVVSPNSPTTAGTHTFLNPSKVSRDNPTGQDGEGFTITDALTKCAEEKAKK